MRGKTKRQIRLKSWVERIQPKTVIVKSINKEEHKNVDVDEGGDTPTWRKFCDETSINGLRYIFGTKPSDIMTRVTWGIIFSLMIIMSLWLSALIVQTYRTANVATSRSFERVTKLPLPAITFCRQNMFAKSKVNNSWHHMRTLATFSLLSDRTEDIDGQAMQEWKYCNSTSSPPDFKDKADFWKKHGYYAGMIFLATESAFIWVDGSNFHVTGKDFMNAAFFYHIVDDIMCITFNPGKQMLASGLGPDDNDTDEAKEFIQQEEVMVGSGVLNGLSMTLRADRGELCGVRQKWQGDGFKVIVHHPEEQPWFLMQKSISIGPSQSIFVALTLTIVKRQTSNLGRCADNVDLHLFPNATMYFKGHCYQQCFAEQVFRTCGCLPPFVCLNQDRDKVYINDQLVDMRNYCWAETMICMNRVKKHFVKTNLNQACPSCKEPCYETQYNIEVTSLLSPTEHTAAAFARERNLTEETYRNEFLTVQFYFPQMLVINVSEWPQFSILDVITYFGGILTLFLGAPILSICEFLQQIIVSGIHYLRCNKANKVTAEQNTTIHQKISRKGETKVPQHR